LLADIRQTLLLLLMMMMMMMRLGRASPSFLLLSVNDRQPDDRHSARLQTIATREFLFVYALLCIFAIYTINLQNSSFYTC